jgi:hypothetical protein
VIDAEETRQLDGNADLLEAFAGGGFPGIFIVMDETPREAPEAIAGLDGSAAEDHAAGRLNHHRGRHLRVAPQHELVVEAGLDQPAFDGARLERGAAVDAEMPHPSRLYETDRRLRRAA